MSKLTNEEAISKVIEIKRKAIELDLNDASIFNLCDDLLDYLRSDRTDD